MRKLLFALVFVPMVCFGENKTFDESSLSDEQLKKFEERFKAEKNIEYDDFSKNSAVELENLINTSNDEMKDNILSRDEMNLVLNELSLKLSFINERLKTRSDDFRPIQFFDTVRDLKINPYSDSNTIELLNLSTISLIYSIDSGDDIYSDMKVIHSKILKHCRSLSIYRDVLMFKSTKIVKK